MTVVQPAPVVAIDPWTAWVSDVRRHADGSFAVLVHVGAAPPAATYAATVRLGSGEECPARVVVRDHGPVGDPNHVEASLMPDTDLLALPLPVALTFTGWLPASS